MHILSIDRIQGREKGSKAINIHLSLTPGQPRHQQRVKHLIPVIQLIVSSLLSIEGNLPVKHFQLALGNKPISYIRGEYLYPSSSSPPSLPLQGILASTNEQRGCLDSDPCLPASVTDEGKEASPGGGTNQSLVMPFQAPFEGKERSPTSATKKTYAARKGMRRCSSARQAGKGR